MKKEILLLALLISVSITAAAQTNRTSSQNIKGDTLPPINPRNEAGILIGGLRFNSFAPEYYLGTFGVNFSSGAIFKHYYDRTALRIGYSYSMQSMNNAGGQWTDENFVTGKETGSMVFVGIQRTFIEKGIFQFYCGIDLAAAYYSFNGNGENYFKTETAPMQEKMDGLGVNPFLGGSFQITPRVKLSAESNFGDWFIRQSTLAADPNRYIITHHFTSAPNPVEAVYVTVVF